jgi:hypothetical protein
MSPSAKTMDLRIEPPEAGIKNTAAIIPQVTGDVNDRGDSNRRDQDLDSLF